MGKSSYKRPGVLVALGVVVLAGLGIALALHDANSENQCCLNKSSNQQAGAQTTDLPSTLDPELFNGDVRQAYLIARENPALLAQLHCYCGCDRYEGHRNLLDCFRDQHGSQCEICIGEVIDAERLFEQGTPVEQIRDILRAKWSKNR